MIRPNIIVNPINVYITIVVIVCDGELCIYGNLSCVIGFVFILLFCILVTSLFMSMSTLS